MHNICWTSLKGRETQRTKHRNKSYRFTKNKHKKSNYVQTTYLVSISMTTNDDGFYPTCHQSGDIFADNSFPEDSATKNVSDGAIW